ncbi:MAG: hypothetical protein AAB733_04540, partial [Patescibacteria group bacterium]
NPFDSPTGTWYPLLEDGGNSEGLLYPRRFAMEPDTAEQLQREFETLVRLACTRRDIPCQGMSEPTLEQCLRCVMDVHLGRGGHIFNVSLGPNQEIILHHTLGPEGRAQTTAVAAAVVRRVLDTLER